MMRRRMRMMMRRRMMAMTFFPATTLEHERRCRVCGRGNALYPRLSRSHVPLRVPRLRPGQRIVPKAL